MHRFACFLAITLFIGAALCPAQDLTIKEVRSWAPERFSLDSIGNNTLPSSELKRLEPDSLRFIVVVVTAEVATPNRESVVVTVDYDQFNLTANGETLAPIGTTTPDGRARAFMEGSKPGKNQIHVSGDPSGTPAKHEFFVGLVFAVPRDTALKLRYNQLQFELKPQSVATLQETIPVKMSVVSSELVPELVGAGNRSRQPFKVLPVIAPRVGKVLLVRFLVEPPTVRNHEQAFPHYFCHSDDFTLVNGGQVVPLHKVLSDGHILKEMFYQIPFSGTKKSKKVIPYTGELIFLVDPAVKTWDLYYGTTKMTTFSPVSTP